MESGEKTPRVIPTPTPMDWCLEGAAALALVGIVLGAWVSYSELPPQVPIHFDFHGNPDGWGSRSTVFMLPAVAAAVYAIMTGVSRIKPWYWNIPAKVTEENAKRVYSATARLMRVVKVEAMALVGLVLWLVVASASADQITGGWFAVVGVAAMVVTVIAGLVVVRRQAIKRA